MKKYIFPIIVVAMAVLAIASFGFKQFFNGGNKAATVVKVLNISDIQADPSSFKGTVTIDGVMAGVAQDDHTIFAIVDTQEVKACKAISCGSFYLPVKYDGKTPTEGDELQVTGNFTGSGSNLLFKATAVKDVGNVIKVGQ